MIDKDLIEEIKNNPDRFGLFYDAHYSIILFCSAIFAIFFLYLIVENAGV